MADKRINALANTASSTASDDFIAVDGTTNGTRKLNAFSPTFGGNATVTGTLTVNGVGESTFGGITRVNNGALVASGSSAPSSGTGVELQHDGTTGRILSYNRTGAAGQLLTINHAGGNIELGSTATQVSVKGTTASTTTSTGALVVGNGTSGGLGVGGAASIGGPILVGTSSDVYLSRVGAGILDIRSASSPGTAARLDVTGTTSAGLGLRQTGTRDWFISAESSELRVSCLTAASIFAFNSGTPVAMRDTTASTSTSSGALVVSGGVGVAGAIVAGGAITSTASTDSGLLQLNLVNSSTGTSASSLFRFNAGTRTASLQAYNDTHATLAGQLRVSTSNGDIVVIPSGVTAATFTASGTTFAGAIAIGNTVNTVSPTSPNRTITMVIGGTTYYLAAKTTND